MTLDSVYIAGIYNPRDEMEMTEALKFQNESVKNPAADQLSKLKEARSGIQAAFGQVVLALGSVPRYRNQSIADLQHMVIDPLVHDCIAVATLRSDGSDASTAFAPAAVAIWASVSDEVQEKIREQIEARAFPIRLKAQDWKSGDNAWLLDIVAPNRDLATEVLKSFNRICGTDSINIHPIVTQLVDKEMLSYLVAKAEAGNSVGKH